MNCRLTESKINPGESLSDLAGFSLKIGRAACSFSSYRQSAISYVLCRVSLVSFSSFFFPSRVVPFVASRYDIIQVADTRAQILWQRNRVDDLSPLPLVNRNSRIEFLHLRTWNVLFCPCFFVIFCLNFVEWKTIRVGICKTRNENKYFSLNFKFWHVFQNRGSNFLSIFLKFCSCFTFASCLLFHNFIDCQIILGGWNENKHFSLIISKLTRKIVELNWRIKFFEFEMYSVHVPLVSCLLFYNFVYGYKIKQEYTMIIDNITSKLFKKSSNWRGDRILETWTQWESLTKW